MFSVNTANIPWCPTYRQATYIWDASKDCSSKAVWGSNSRPIDSPRMRHKAITRHDDDSFSFDLYGTQMIRYYKDGTVGGTVHHSRSSAAFASRLSPMGVCMATIHGRTYLVFISDSGEQYALPEDNHFKLKPITPGCWKLLTPCKQRTRMVADRKKTADINKAFKPFYDWVIAAERIADTSKIMTASRSLERCEITIPPTVEQYHLLVECASSLDSLKPKLHDYFGAYSRVDIPNTKRPQASRLGHYKDS